MQQMGTILRLLYFAASPQTRSVTAPAPIPIRIQGHGLPMGMNLHIEWFLYGAVILGIVAVYLVISGVLTGKIKRIVPAEVLKNRE